MKKYFKLFRVKHYIKNVLIFIPAFFGRDLLNIKLIINLIIAFWSFSFATSFVYIINDLKDIEADKQHELKKKRPIASGEVPIKSAVVIAGVLLVISIISTLYVCKFQVSAASLLLLLYIALNLIYSVGGGKKKPIVDVLILAAGFVIRVLYGAAVSNIVCSNWLILTVMAASMYLGLGKRRNELTKVSDGSTREVLKKYSISYLDNMMKVFLTLILIFYSLWCADITYLRNTNSFVWTLPVIIVIVMKYELDIDSDSYGDPVEVVLGDKILMFMVLFYSLVMFTLMYVL